jgi:hypothetical protein
MYVYTPKATAEIGNFEPLNEFTSIKVDLKQELGNKAFIDLPRNIQVLNTDAAIDTLLKKGDPVVISGGYQGFPKKVEFVGFISKVHNDRPIRIECEDYNQLLKLDTHSFTLKDPTLNDILNQVLNAENVRLKRGDHPFDIEVTDTGKLYDSLSVDRLNGSKILDKLTSDFPFRSYFKHDADTGRVTLFIGFAYSDIPNASKPILRFGENVPERSWRLTYKNPDDNQILIRAISNQKNGEKIIVEVGDPGGDVQTRNFQKMDKARLTELANEELRFAKRDGFAGELTALGLPHVSFGDVVRIEDPVYSKTESEHYVDRIRWELNSKPGITRKISLGLKA